MAAAAAAASRLPTLFAAHGGGPLPLTGDAAHARLAQWLTTVPRTLPHKPKAVLVISAHWEVRGAAGGGAPHPPRPQARAHTHPPLLLPHPGVGGHRGQRRQARAHLRLLWVSARRASARPRPRRPNARRPPPPPTPQLPPRDVRHQVPGPGVAPAGGAGGGAAGRGGHRGSAGSGTGVGPRRVRPAEAPVPEGRHPRGGAVAAGLPVCQGEDE